MPEPSASSAEAALAIAPDGHIRIDLLLTNVVMPGISGRQLADRLVKSHPKTRVLFTSGYTEDVIVKHGVLDHGIEFLSKPYTIETLSRRAREMLDKPRR